MKKLSVFILIGLLSVSVFANNNWYGGIGVVKSSLDESIVDSGTAYNFEYDKVNIKAFIGIKLSNNLAGEFQYTNFAKEDITVNGISVPVGIEGNSFGGALLYNFAPESDISAFAKIGYHSWDFDISANNVTASTDDTDLFYGAGVDIKITGKLVARLDYERFDLDDTKIDNFGASIVFGF